MKTFLWDAPKNLTGTFAAEIQVDIPTSTFCSVRVDAEGTVRDDIPLLLWSRSVLAPNEPGYGVSTGHLRNHERVHAHAAGVSTGPATPWDYGPFATAEGTTWGPGLTPGTLNYTIAAFGLEDREDAGDEHPLHINITCEDPVEVTGLWGSRQAVGFTEQSFTDGGAGLSVDTALNHHLIVQKNATLKAAFDTDRVRAQANLDASEKPSGTFTLTQPNGTGSWSLSRDLYLTRGNPWSDGVTDGAGNYTIEVSIADRIEGFGIQGALVGLNPVDSLDDVAETCDPNNPLGEPDPCLEV